LAAWHKSIERSAPFSEVHIADKNPAILQAAASRLRHANAPVFVEQGTAAETVDRVIAKLDPDALHFAFLDPFNLEALAFEIIRKLARKLNRIDILLHVSALDLNRNLRDYIEIHPSPSISSVICRSTSLSLRAAMSPSLHYDRSMCCGMIVTLFPPCPREGSSGGQAGVSGAAAQASQSKV
jgi:hypothetical protein